MLEQRLYQLRTFAVQTFQLALGQPQIRKRLQQPAYFLSGIDRLDDETEETGRVFAGACECAIGRAAGEVLSEDEPGGAGDHQTDAGNPPEYGRNRHVPRMRRKNPGHRITLQ